MLCYLTTNRAWIIDTVFHESEIKTSIKVLILISLIIVSLDRKRKKRESRGLKHKLQKYIGETYALAMKCLD